MRKFLLLILLFFCIFHLYGIFNKYSFIKVDIIQNGKEKENLGCWPKIGFGGVGHISPTTYAIGPDNNFYFNDDQNKRIAIFDQNLNFIKEIKIMTNILTLKVGNDGSIIYKNYNGLYKLNFMGDILWHKGVKELPSRIVVKNDFFPFNDYVLYYDDQGKINFYDANGNNLIKKDFDELLKNTFVNNNIKHKSNNTIINKIVSSQVQEFLGENNIFLVDNKLLSNDKRKFQAYFNFLNENNIADNNPTSRNINKITNELDFNPYKIIGELLNYDTDGNIYMTGFLEGRLILVFSNHGTLLDAFYYDFHEYWDPQVAPNGDVYFWRVQEDGVYIFKVERVW